MKHLLNTFELHRGRYLVKIDTKDITGLKGDEVFQIIQAIESNGYVWEYLKIEK